jgi:hypothetical protein
MDHTPIQIDRPSCAQPLSLNRLREFAGVDSRFFGTSWYALSPVIAPSRAPLALLTFVDALARGIAVPGSFFWTAYSAPI